MSENDLERLENPYCLSVETVLDVMARNAAAKEIRRLQAELAEANAALVLAKDLSKKSLVEWCQEERAAGNGGCSACALCYKEDNAARERAEAKCAVAPDAPKSWVLTDENWSHILKFAKQYAEWRGQDNLGQPLLDKLARVEALKENWRKWADDNDTSTEPEDMGRVRAHRGLADELEQALKGESRVNLR